MRVGWALSLVLKVVAKVIELMAKLSRGREGKRTYVLAIVARKGRLL